MARVTRKFRVSVTPCSSSEKHLSCTTVVSTETRNEAIDRAITKMYGSRCFWFPDFGLPGYGQVFEALQPTSRNSNPGNSARTYRASLDVEPLTKKSRAFLEQEAIDRAEHEEYIKYENQRQEAENAGFGAGWNGAAMPTEPSEFSYDIRNGYSGGQNARAEADDEERQRAAEEQRGQERARREYEEFQQAQVQAENDRRSRHAEKIAAEVARLRKIDVSKPITDAMLAPIVRNTIAPATFQQGAMSLGEWKRMMLNGELPETVTAYLQSDGIFERLEYKIPEE